MTKRNFAGLRNLPAAANAAIQNRRGMALIATLFLLVVLGAMGISLSMIYKNRHMKNVNNLHSQQAHYAAVSGMEWAYQKATDGVLSGASLASLNGTYTLPSGQRFEITVSEGGILSKGIAGGSERIYRFPNFAALFGGTPRRS